MRIRRSPITAVLLCLVALAFAGCSQNDAPDAQAKVDKAKAQLQDAQAQLDKAKQGQAAEAEKNQGAAEKPADTAAAEKKQAERRPTQTQTQSRDKAQSNKQPVCNDCGTVSSITPVTQNASKGSGVGAVAGGVAGAVVGSQIGHGTGKTIAQIAGTLGGAFAGNEVEKRVRKETYYQVNVAMDAGGTRTVKVNTANSIGSGSRVRVQGNNLVLMQ